MAGASTTTSVAFIMKRQYDERQQQDVAMREHTLLSMAKKVEGVGGDDFRHVVKFSNVQGVSGTHSEAVNAVESSAGAQFASSPVTKYTYITLDGPSMQKARGNKQSFYNLVTMEVDGALEQIGDDIGFDLYRSGNGLRGRRSSISSNVVTLTNAEDAHNFFVNMSVVASANADGSSPRTNTGQVKVVAVDEDSGTVELDDASNIASFTDNDWLFREGDPSSCLDGLGDIIPTTAPVYGSDSFRGVDRGQAVRQLAGCRVSASGSIEHDAGLLCVKLRQTAKGGKGQKCWFGNPLNFWEVVRKRDAKVEYTNGGGTATVGFEYINIATPAGIVKFYSDPDCPDNAAYVGSMDYLELRHSGPFIAIVREGANAQGFNRLPASSGDGIEMLVRSMPQLFITRPAAWGTQAI